MQQNTKNLSFDAPASNNIKQNSWQIRSLLGVKVEAGASTDGVRVGVD